MKYCLFLPANIHQMVGKLVEDIGDRKLANFCRVLAITISDLDIYENKSSRK